MGTNFNNMITPKKIAQFELAKKIERYMRRGYTNQHEIAIALGIPQTRVSYYIRYIHKRWQKEAPADYEAKIIYRIRQLENLIQESYLAYDKSKKGEESQSWISRPCTACAGAEDAPDVDHPDPPCSECGGSGKVTTMHSAIKDSAGDPAYLKVAQDCIKECARLETLLLNGGQARPRKIEITGTMAVIPVAVPPQYVGVAADKLLEARALLQSLAVDPAMGPIEGTVVRREVESSQ